MQFTSLLYTNTWTKGAAWDKTDTSCFPSLIAIPGISIFNALVRLVNIGAVIGKTVSFCSPLLYSCIRLVKIFYLQVFLSNFDIYITSHSTKVTVLHFNRFTIFYRKSQYVSTKIRIDPIVKCAPFPQSFFNLRFIYRHLSLRTLYQIHFHQLAIYRSLLRRSGHFPKLLPKIFCTSHLVWLFSQI